MIDASFNYEFFDTNAFIRKIRMELAQRIYMAASFFKRELQGRLSTAYPPASTPGEYPHARSFWGRNAVTIYPSDLGKIAQTLKVQIGYLQSAFYMGVLEEQQRRLGLFHLFKELQPELRSILGTRSYVSAA